MVETESSEQARPLSIVKLTIQGFATYKNQTVVGPFDPHHNIVIGRNGSGKSNFFKAIRFVLGDVDLSHRDTREELLYRGAGSTVMSAFVEIVFDNRGGRFATPNSEVVIRRTVGRKKDEFSVDKKNVSRQEAMKLLENAGFSEANPYYIVPQGRISHLTAVSDEDRLKILKDVAGTGVYEKRRTESQNIVDETQRNREKISETLDYFDKRLDELEDEKRELREFQQLEDRKRALDYTIYYRELAQLSRQQETLAVDLSDHQHNMSALMDAFNVLDEQIATEEAQQTAAKEQLELLELERNNLNQDYEELVASQAQADVRYTELVENKSQAANNQKLYQEEHDRLLALIAQKEEELKALEPQFERIQARETALLSQVTDAENLQSRLQSKQGRGARFSSKAERDKWLRAEISDIQRAITEKAKYIGLSQSEVDELRRKIETTSASIATKRQELESASEDYHKAKRDEAAAEAKRSQLSDEQKTLRRDEHRLEMAAKSAQEAVRKAESSLSESTSRDVFLGLAAIERFVAANGIEGVYGPLYDIFSVSDKYKLATEVTAGTSLFHVVVENDDVASLLLAELRRQNAGRATFMPLNRLKVIDRNYPRDEPECVPLVDQLQFDAKFAPAVHQVFGNMLVCAQLKDAERLAHSHKLDAITLKGDRVDSKGVMTGGYHDTRKSRLTAVGVAKAARTTLDELRQEHTKVKFNLSLVDQHMTAALNDISRITDAHRSSGGKLRAIETAIRSLTAEEAELKGLLSTKSKTLASLQAGIKSLTDEKNAHQSDVSTPFDVNLTDSEARELEAVTTSLPDLRARLQQYISERSSVEQAIATLQIELEQDLYVSRDELVSKEVEVSDAGNEAVIAAAEKQVEDLSNRVQQILEQISALEADADKASRGLQERQKEVGHLKEQQLDCAQELERRRKATEKTAAKRSLLQARQDELNVKVRGLGALPDQLEEYENLHSSKVLETQKSTAEELKKYSHINRRAAEQFANFTRDRESLLARQEELNKSYDSILTLIETLDQQKDEAIDRTIKQVSVEFSKIFEKLVPTGSARLVVQRNPALSQGSLTDSYVGIGISVSFNSKHDDQQRVQQLSGGQKTLCALTLIFAIQKSDPAPFYLFDEIDANLDPQYRTSVSAVMKELSQDAQFICTTFHPEMLDVANKFFGVIYQDKMSTVRPVTHEDAIGFVEGAAAEGAR